MDDGPRIGVRLRATVAPVGVVGRPAVAVKLPKTVFKSMEPISIELRKRDEVFLAAFAWGVDNKVCGYTR